jgi:hypothetical protein
LVHAGDRRFLGIIITMYYGEHPPPHFHVRYGEHKAVVSVDPPALMRGFYRLASMG